MQERRAKAVNTPTSGVSGLFKKNKIDLIEGHGAVTDTGNVRVGGLFDGDEIEAGAVILATDWVKRSGSRAVVRWAHHRHRGGLGAQGTCPPASP